jgi:hypothetical protein
MWLMALYFLQVDADAFHQSLRPALAASWRQRSFMPCRPLCQRWLAKAEDFAQRYHLGDDQPLLAAVAGADVAFDRTLWQHLAGELLWFGAAAIPEISTSAEALACLLAKEWVDRLLHGSHDLVFGGGFYRPDRAGWNDTPDVVQLDDFLAAVRPETWPATALAGLTALTDDADRLEELEFVRDGFPALVDMYRQARQQGQIVVCERLE